MEPTWGSEKGDEIEGIQASPLASVDDSSYKAQNEAKKDETLCGNKIMLLNLILMTTFWTASSFSYYMITFFLKYIPGNIYVNTSLSAIAEIIAYVVSGFFMKFMGIKLSFMLAFGLGATEFLSLLVIVSRDG